MMSDNRVFWQHQLYDICVLMNKILNNFKCPILQLWKAFGNLIGSLGVGWFLCLVWQYPLSVGLEKAVLCTKRMTWLRAGRHPREEVNNIEAEYEQVLRYATNGRQKVARTNSELINVKQITNARL